jgi:hypothetical protein
MTASTNTGHSRSAASTGSFADNTGRSTTGTRKSARRTALAYRGCLKPTLKRQSRPQVRKFTSQRSSVVGSAAMQPACETACSSSTWNIAPNFGGKVKIDHRRDPREVRHRAHPRAPRAAGPGRAMGRGAHGCRARLDPGKAPPFAQPSERPNPKCRAAGLHQGSPGLLTTG